jgi:hypothetical protein
MASGINSTFRQVGIATGIAAWGALFQNRVTTAFGSAAAHEHLAVRRPPGAGSVADFIAFGGAQRTGNPALITAADTAFDAGLNHILLLAAVVALAGAVLCVLLVRPADFVARPEAARAEPAGQAA